jgi:signal transduction histidine kinase
MSGGSGLNTLAERAGELGAELTVSSEPGKGTRVQVFIPLTEEAADRLHHSPAKQ